MLNEQIKQTGDTIFNKETIKSVRSLKSKKKLTALNVEFWKPYNSKIYICYQVKVFSTLKEEWR